MTNDSRDMKRTDDRFRQIVEAAPNAMVLVGKSGLIEMVNTQAEKIFGYNRAELLGQSIDCLLPERFRHHHPQHRASFFSDLQPRAMGIGRDLYGRRKDGSEFPVEVGLNPIETEDGIKVLSAITDISARKRMEERFRLVVEAAPNAMVMVDKSGLIEMVNTQAEKIFGYSRAELLGQSIDYLLPERFRHHHPQHRASFFSDLQPRAMGIGRDLFGRHKDGSEFPVEVGLNPIETEDG
ncbi:MAG TPA: PAS domain-containing sensor histidine kinase, partial [Methylotenera mobilis]|nr:PAS domain-containing sensor histidine kinase [Methylotenera mobilis]